MRCALHSLAGILLSLCAATQAQAISEERVQNLYDFLDIALRCEVASGVLKVSLASQRNQLQEMLTSTGMELGEAMLDKSAHGDKSVIDLVKSRNIETVLLLMVGTTVPQKPLRRNSPEIDALAAPVPETYWLWTELLQTLINR